MFASFGHRSLADSTTVSKSGDSRSSGGSSGGSGGDGSMAAGSGSWTVETSRNDDGSFSTTAVVVSSGLSVRTKRDRHRGAGCNRNGGADCNRHRGAGWMHLLTPWRSAGRVRVSGPVAARSRARCNGVPRPSRGPVPSAGNRSVPEGPARHGCTGPICGIGGPALRERGTGPSRRYGCPSGVTRRLEGSYPLDADLPAQSSGRRREVFRLVRQRRTIGAVGAQDAGGPSG